MDKARPSSVKGAGVSRANQTGATWPRTETPVAQTRIATSDGAIVAMTEPRRMKSKPKADGRGRMIMRV